MAEKYSAGEVEGEVQCIKACLVSAASIQDPIDLIREVTILMLPPGVHVCLSVHDLIKVHSFFKYFSYPCYY